MSGKGPRVLGAVSKMSSASAIQKGLRPVLQQIMLDHSQPLPRWHSPDACVKGQPERIPFVDGRCTFLFMDDPLFIPQCIDRFHPGCCASRVNSEEYSDSDGKTDSKKDRRTRY